MASINEHLILRAATVDELLSEDFEIMPGQKGDTELAASRVAGWCRAASSGDWLLFGRRLQRDGQSLDQVLARLARVSRKVTAPTPPWAEDAIWIEAALGSSEAATGISVPEEPSRYPFEHLFVLVVAHAEARLWASFPLSARELFTESARLSLRQLLLGGLCRLAAPALYERFQEARQADDPASANGGSAGLSTRYDRFVADMKADGFDRLFNDKPVLLRLIATSVRQWIDASQEFVARLQEDLPAIAGLILRSETAGAVVGIEGGLSDPHHGGRSVLIVEFQHGHRVVYKPKDLRIDLAWAALVTRLNGAAAPVLLRTPRMIAADGYGWSEFVPHEGCADAQGFARFFRRAGAWLALFHAFAGTDMHQENLIAAGDDPVPIDLEMLLQTAGNSPEAASVGAQAFEAAREMIANSVMAVGLLPAYGNSGGDNVFAIGGLASDSAAETKLVWDALNSDAMRPRLTREPAGETPNIPHVDGCYAKLGHNIDDLVGGFVDYARFLSRVPEYEREELLRDFAGLPVRKVLRPTQFYYMLLQRLRDHRSMADGVLWSAQADFLARLADWESASDPLWPLQIAERAALLALNVPRFTRAGDGYVIDDMAGHAVRSADTPGLERARTRLRKLGREIGWQTDVIRQNTGALSSVDPDARPRPRLPNDSRATPQQNLFRAEADRIADEIAGRAVRRRGSAAWIGMSWLRGSEVSQLTVMGPDLYNGASGIALFLAAHGAVAERAASRDLALAAVARLRATLRSRNAARMARSLGIGGATGLGSIVYGFTVLAQLLRNEGLLEDAYRAAQLIGDDLIAADRQLDVMGGSAGAILGLLRLYRDSGSRDILERAVRCGEHLLLQPRAGVAGLRSWRGQGAHTEPLNGMSHGAAGFAFAMVSLANAAARQDFAEAARECIAFENGSFDTTHANWPDFRSKEAHWRSQWCHGAVGIGLARTAIAKCSGWHGPPITDDIRNAVAGVQRSWPGQVDTLCCGLLGGVEFLNEAAGCLELDSLAGLAARRLAAVVEESTSVGDYRWNGGERRFNLGFFRGLAGIGYTCLRQIDRTLPNVLVWE